ncbi:class I SAM-dependent methyltransferase [Oceanomicrobium pacificus]|uniref:Methyltransferase domain-containing protein n=1 Tax=Oceanomicrobium pacificus TaxID=2692916 RepID=A0A6B0TMP0_9RHOB|nr:class I SAM-dependent methyltransferase [Oceanomicrobium pacificus]MXU65126.1 methyltransferase domain-containing protein [Oceanomicrobium pacificus]
MDEQIFQRFARREAEHWWCIGRRAILRDTVAAEIPKPDGRPLRILDAGCGTGGNLPVLAEFGDVDGFEFNDGAAALASERLGKPVPFGALPDGIPDYPDPFDLIVLLDVLEHIEDDRATLRNLAAKLAPDGRLLVTVPAFQFLWSRHDELHHHFRRYTKATLSAVAQDAGLTVEKKFYFNSTLFPAAVAQRMAMRLKQSDAPDADVPRPVINETFKRIFLAERHIVRHVPMPVGLSLGAVLTLKD